MMRPTPSCARTAGFTLVEMLVALALLALLAAYLPQAYRLVRQTWAASILLAEDSTEQSVRTFVSARLSEAMPLFERKPDGDEIAFSGKTDEVTFVAASPRGPGGGGLYRFRIYRGGEGHTGSSVLASITPYAPPADQQDDTHPSPQPEVHRLAGSVGGFAVRYFGRPAPRETHVWQSEWTRNDALPDLVEITLRRADKAASPPIVVELRLRSGL